MQLNDAVSDIYDGFSVDKMPAADSMTSIGTTILSKLSAATMSASYSINPLPEHSMLS